MPGRPVPPPAACAVLVDEHVLDSYLALAALRPGKAYLVHTAECSEPAARLAHEARGRLGIPCARMRVDDDSDPAAIAAAYARLPRGVHLHHTGGTGSLSALLRAAHAAAGCPPSTASGLDETRRLLRIDDGRDIALEALIDPATVSLEIVCALNGFTEQPDRGDEERQAITDAAVAAVDWSRPRPRAGSIFAALNPELERRRPATGMLARPGPWQNFLHGGAFEHLVGGVVQAAAPAYEVRVGVHLHRGDTRVELDVIAVGHYRPHIISCASSHSPQVAKQKLFEVLTRARQVGGASARAALACLLADDSPTSPAELEAMGETDPSPNARPVVFGAADVLSALRGDRARWSDYLAS